MHVNAKRIAIAGLLAAFSAVLLVLSTVVETSSLFFIGVASFCVGITIREWGLRFGFAFCVASTAVNLIVTPQKFYCITYAAMSLYLLLSEWLWRKIADQRNLQHRNLLLWTGKYIIFNIVYIPALLFFREMLFVQKIEGIEILIAFLVGQVVLWVYDKAYLYFQSSIWGKLRGKLLKL